MKWAANQFERVLFRLFRDRTHRLRDLVKSPGSGKVPGFNRKKREKAIGELQKLASSCLVKDYAKREFKKLVDKKRQWHVTTKKGWGRDKKKKSFDSWFSKHIPFPNCIYVFWAGPKCKYVGRTIKGKGRPHSHFNTYWFGCVTRIDIYSTSLSSEVPKLEFLATHRFNPTMSKIKSSKKKWTRKCPVCQTHKTISNEIRTLFRLK